MMTDAEYQALLAKVKALPPMTPDERVAQALSFAYGNLACSTNHKPERRAFRAIALERGWTEERFNEWAAQHHWWYGKMLMLVPARSPERLAQIRGSMSAIEGFVVPPDGFTCDTCAVKPTCPCAFDPYNTGGDCLAEK
jgi:hypothetical protein